MRLFNESAGKRHASCEMDFILEKLNESEFL